MEGDLMVIFLFAPGKEGLFLPSNSTVLHRITSEWGKHKVSSPVPNIFWPCQKITYDLMIYGHNTLQLPFTLEIQTPQIAHTGENITFSVQVTFHTTL